MLIEEISDPKSEIQEIVGVRSSITDRSLPVACSPLPVLRPYQIEAAQAIGRSAMEERGLTFTVVMARQAGKNELSAQIEMFILQKNAQRALDGIKCAPTFEPQCQVSLRRLWSHIVQAGLETGAAKEDSRAIRIGRALSRRWAQIWTKIRQEIGKKEG